METQKAAILAALQITDELFRERSAVETLTTDIRMLAAEIRPLLPPAKRVDDGHPL
jgi:cell division protein ZapA